MDLTRYARRSIAALAIVLLAAGTAFAAERAGSNQTGTALTSQAGESAEQSESAEPSESPEPSESAEPSESPKAAESAEPSESPEPSEAPKAATQANPSNAELTRLVDLLKAAGITTTTSELSALAAQVGVGGAVRVLSFAHASGKTPAAILAMFQGGMGWGQITHQLGLSVGPGIGWIMSQGHGKGGSHGRP